MSMTNRGESPSPVVENPDVKESAPNLHIGGADVKADPRVEIAAEGMLGTAGITSRRDAERALAALESAGWRIVKLEQVGIVCDDGSILPIPDEGEEQYDDDVPVYRITEEKP